MDPAIKEAITSFFSMMWDIFVRTQVPYFGINFGQIYIGLFATSAIVVFLQKTTDSETFYGSGKKDYKKHYKDRNAYMEKE